MTLLTLVRRILLLSAVSIVGVALLSPLAALSAPEPDLPDPAADVLLPRTAETAPLLALDRGALTARTARVDASTSEELEPAALPTPATAPMEATLHAVATPPPAQPPAAAPARRYSGDSVWDALAQCESGGNWSINTGNGYYGGLQFNYATWHAYGGGEFAEYPHQATREQQIAVAERLRAARGYAPWPACRAKLGLP